MSRSPRHESRIAADRSFKNNQNGVASKVGTTNPWVESAKAASTSVVERVETAIRKRPLTSLGIAVGVGMLVGLWSKRK